MTAMTELIRAKYGITFLAGAWGNAPVVGITLGRCPRHHGHTTVISPRHQTSAPSTKRQPVRQRMLPIMLVLMILFAPCATRGETPTASSDAVARPPAAPALRPWLDEGQDAPERIRLLLSEMTLEEKIGQMSQSTAISPAAIGTDKGRAEKATLDADIISGRTGSVLNESDADAIRSLQQLALERSRLGIPLIIGRDVIHGFRTIFPIPRESPNCR